MNFIRNMFFNLQNKQCLSEDEDSEKYKALESCENDDKANKSSDSIDLLTSDSSLENLNISCDSASKEVCITREFANSRYVCEIEEKDTNLVKAVDISKNLSDNAEISLATSSIHHDFKINDSCMEEVIKNDFEKDLINVNDSTQDIVSDNVTDFETFLKTNVIEKNSSMEDFAYAQIDAGQIIDLDKFYESLGDNDYSSENTEIDKNINNSTISGNYNIIQYIKEFDQVFEEYTAVKASVEQNFVKQASDTDLEKSKIENTGNTNEFSKQSSVYELPKRVHAEITEKTLKRDDNKSLTEEKDLKTVNIQFIDDILQIENESDRASSINVFETLNEDILSDISEHTTDLKDNDVISISSTDDLSLNLIKNDALNSEDDVEKDKTDTMENDAGNSENDIEKDKTVTRSLNDDQNDLTDSDGYNSSDFEFITESEAELDGLIINLVDRNIKTPKNFEKSSVYTVEIAKEMPREHKYFNNESKPSTSNALTERPQHSDITSKHTKDYYNILRQQYDISESRHRRESHVVPQGENYMNMFQRVQLRGCNSFNENKSVIPTRYMHVQYEGVGFDLRGPRDVDEEKHQAEADESMKMILDMYPTENRKRRRRH